MNRKPTKHRTIPLSTLFFIDNVLYSSFRSLFIFRPCKWDFAFAGFRDFWVMYAAFAIVSNESGKIAIMFHPSTVQMVRIVRINECASIQCASVKRAPNKATAKEKKTKKSNHRTKETECLATMSIIFHPFNRKMMICEWMDGVTALFGCRVERGNMIWSLCALAYEN